MYLLILICPLSVREIQTTDIPKICQYWLENDDAFLEGMGVDLTKLPTREQLTQMLEEQIRNPLSQKINYALIWFDEGEAVGHCNANKIQFGKEAYMHLHLWNLEKRKKGIGTRLVNMSLPYFFENLELDTLYCEPYALNPAPNKTLEKVGFKWLKKYLTIPGSLNFEQEVNRWYLDRASYATLSEKGRVK